ncbi:DUF3274 domain-containing protein [Burkholderia sp. Bp9031]|uniref:DUF3274 domain-containing protein n=1 Tax=Burkholderia sp. Bp9031 TaxID=2184566 RepID=UPI0021AB415E
MESYKTAFNQGKAINDQSQNWRVVPNTSATSLIKNALLPVVPPQQLIQREETPNEARARMQQDPDAREANNYHSGVLHSTENHRWVTAMDVAIGQAVTLDDPVWRELLILMADWKMAPASLAKIQKNANYGRLDSKMRDFIQACSDYYMYGTFPEAHVSSTPPPLVTSELTSAAIAAQEKAQAEYYKQEAQKAQMMYGNKTIGEVFQGMPR